MKRFHAAILAIGFLFIVSAGCETLGVGKPKRTTEDIKKEAYGEPDDPSQSRRDTSDRALGAWSSEARDIERNMMRNNSDPNWQR